MPTTFLKRVSPITLTLSALLIALAACNGLLIAQNLRMRAALDKFRPSVLKPGDKVEEFVAQDIKGQQIRINYTGAEAKRVFLYFTPTCPYCHEQFPYWKEILERANRNQFQVLGLVAETEDKIKVNEYLRSTGCEDLRIAFVPKSVFVNYKLSTTPTTLIVSHDGKVENAWPGRWSAAAAADAGSILGISFSQHLLD